MNCEPLFTRMGTGYAEYAFLKRLIIQRTVRNLRTQDGRFRCRLLNDQQISSELVHTGKEYFCG